MRLLFILLCLCASNVFADTIGDRAAIERKIKIKEDAKRQAEADGRARSISQVDTATAPQTPKIKATESEFYIIEIIGVEGKLSALITNGSDTFRVTKPGQQVGKYQVVSLTSEEATLQHGKSRVVARYRHPTLGVGAVGNTTSVLPSNVPMPSGPLPANFSAPR